MMPCRPQFAALALAAFTTLSLGCGEDETAGSTQSILLARINLVNGVDDDGRLLGINLDDQVHEAATADACYAVDGTAPDGVPGIDNQFSLLSAAIIAQLGADADAIVQSSINDGRLLIIAELTRVNSFDDDPDVGVRLVFGTGPVNIGTDGYPEPGQSFDLSDAIGSVYAEEASIVDGRLRATGFNVDLPINVLQSTFTIPMRGAALQLDLEPDGHGEGVLGGTISRDEVRAIIAADEVLAPALPAVELLLRGLPDMVMGDDGVCDGISAGFDISGKPAFLLED